MSHESSRLLIGLAIGIVVGGIGTFALARAVSEKPPRTRDELLHKAQELNLRALRAPAA